MKKILIAMASLLSTIMILSACNDNPDREDSKDLAKEENNMKFDSTAIIEDTKFAVNAADAGLMEVLASQLALKVATSQSVRNFAQMMVDAHSAGNDELRSIANAKNISLPASLSENKQKKYNDLSSKTGKDFEKEYIDCMINEHKDAVDLFEKETEKGNDQDLREWARNKLPTLNQHLDQAQSIKKNKN